MIGRSNADQSSRAGPNGRYEVLGTLGEGGMGAVLRAHDRELDRQVAIKVLRRELDPHHTVRLRREAQALAKLSHPNVVQVYEVGELEGQTFVVMELVRGRTLAQWMAQVPPPGWRACVELFVQIGAGLAAAHEQGLVHRDFKPSNAIIDDEGRPRVLDFGLARRSEGDESASSEHEPSDPVACEPRLEPGAAVLDESITRTGTVLGTPAYMPLEQMQGRPVDARSDQFSFCVSLYEAVYGERPYVGASMGASMVAMRRAVVRPAPRGHEVPLALRQVLLRGLAADPEQRWSSMDALLAALREVVAPRRRWWMVLTVGAGLMTTAAVLGLLPEPSWGERCTGARLELRGVWDDERRQEVGAAILGTGLSYAPGTWDRVALRLDDYAEAWAAKYTDVCESTRTRPEHDADVLALRRGCMLERKQALRAAVEVLATVDVTVVAHAVDLVGGLPRFDRCDDLDALRAEVSPPEDPAVARAVEAMRIELDDYEAARKAGLHASALERVEPLVERAEALGYGPLVAEAKALRGTLREDVGRYAEAEQDLLDAHALAVEHRHDEVAIGAALGLVTVVGLDRARHAEGRTWGRTALAYAERSGDAMDLARCLSNLAVVSSSRGEYEQARHDFEQVLQLEEETLGPEHPEVAGSLSNLATVLRSQGDYERAELHFERALQIFEQALGPDHPHVAMALMNLGTVLHARAEHERATPCFERALRINEQALGPDHPEVAKVLTNLGFVLGGQGKQAEARLHLERALRINEQALGPDHPAVALDLMNLTHVLHGPEEREQARLHLERALRVSEDALGPDHPQVADILGSLGARRHDEGQYEVAARHLERAMRIRENALGPDHPGVAIDSNNLARVLESQGDREQARHYYERSLRGFEKALGPDHPHVISPLLGLTRVALLREDFDTARLHAERILAFRQIDEIAAEAFAEARFALARALWSDRTQRARAHALAEQARDDYAELGDTAGEALAEVEAWLARHLAR
ncbi:serine/threonine-protein kinase [Paraliomyxa miuraensis]|uniref:serine/threonine-protein kinase n=1 Tax=Paraliomyxa miuraensis TaxID=376150 RepID=UPI002253230A|nr:serine/threonine-protein kinase [Paraliomyxa miuraensis]MCX4247339.1 tetratricopeptide repeat protein [Paraliomyxa miuraensis]